MFNEMFVVARPPDAFPNQLPWTDPNSATMKITNLTPFDDNNWASECKILPSNAFIRLLEESRNSAKRRLWRIPVIVELDGDWRRLIRSAYIGVVADLATEDRIYLSMEDSALGVSLAERMNQYCPNEHVCRLWVAGYWGMKEPHFGENPDPHDQIGSTTFSLRAILGSQSASDNSNAEAIARFRDG